MKEHLEKRCDDLATHLLTLEQRRGLKKQKRAKSSVKKFRLSTAWLCKRLLAAQAASNNAGMRISKDKNRYKKSRYLPEGISYDVTILGVLAMMYFDGWVRTIRRGGYMTYSEPANCFSHLLSAALAELEWVRLPSQYLGNK